MSNQTDGENIVYYSPILSSRPEMVENMIERLVDVVFKHLRLLEKVTFFCVESINKRVTNLHIV